MISQWFYCCVTMSLSVDATLFEWYAHVWIDINVDHKPFIVTVRFAVNDGRGVTDSPTSQSQDSAAAAHKKKDSNWLTGRFSDVISEFDSLACVFDTVCIIIQDLKSVWFICRQLNFDSKCQVSCRYYIELNSEALQARPLHHCRSVTAVKLLS